MSPKVYINGKLFDKADAKISVYDHGLLYGDGVFEGIRVYARQGLPARASTSTGSTNRPRRSTSQIPMSRERDGRGRSTRPLAVNKLVDGYIRAGRHARRRQPRPRPAQDDRPAGHHHRRRHQPLSRRSCTSTAWRSSPPATIRNHPNAVNPRIKSLNYLNNILAKIEGINAGCLEALMLNHKGEVAECTGDNIFLVKHGRAAHAVDRRRHPRRDHPRRRDRAGPGGRASRSSSGRWTGTTSTPPTSAS